eukprot:60034-Amphidinium_carterae.1
MEQYIVLDAVLDKGFVALHLQHMLWDSHGEVTQLLHPGSRLVGLQEVGTDAQTGAAPSCCPSPGRFALWATA